MSETQTPRTDECHYSEMEYYRMLDHARQLERELAAMTAIAQADEDEIMRLRGPLDARMRLGKAIQYSGDGVSKYDK